MKRQCGVMLTVVLLTACAAAAQTDTAKLLADLSKRTQNTLAVVHFTLVDTAGRDRPMVGQAVCIQKNAKNIGVFITFALSANVKPDQFKDFSLTVPGEADKQIKAEFLAVDPSSNIGFIRATEPFDWTPVEFYKAAPSIGQPVVAVGLMPRETGYAPYLGLGFISAVVRVPEKLIRITGGTLTNVGSPVFSADGRAVGIVGRQLPSGYMIDDGRRSAAVTLRGQQETTYFLPTEEFAYVLEDPPTPGKAHRLPWTGVISFNAVKPEALLTHQDRPAVSVGTVVPGHPADKAGLKELEKIVAFNGQPLERFPDPELIHADFVRKLMRCKPGQKITLSVASGDKTEDRVLTLGEMPPRWFEANQYFNVKLGFQVRDKVMLDKYTSTDPIPDVAGVLVIAAPEEMAAAAAGLQVGDLVTFVNNSSVPDVETFKQAIENALTRSATDPVNLMVRRGDKDTPIRILPK